MREINNIEKLFVERFNVYKKNTMDIIGSMPHVTQAVRLTLVEDEYATLEWEDVQYIPGDSIIVLIGNVKLTIGDDIQLDTGIVVQVTEENVNGLRRMVRIGIPVELALNGTVESVTEFLKGTASKNYTLLDDNSEGTKDEVAQLYDQDYGAEIDLTDDQYEQLKLTPHSKKIH
jgi:hypothetical protein